MDQLGTYDTDEEGSWWQMEAFCRTLDSDFGRSSLATIKKRSEQEFIFKNLVEGHKIAWIGGVRVGKSQYYWYTNLNRKETLQPMRYKHWSSSEPSSSSDDEDCADMDPSSGNWVERDCDLEFTAVCELRC